MRYTSRIVGVGIHKDAQFVSFTLASRSIPFRELRVDNNKGKINVFPRRGYEEHTTNQDPEVDNYSCIRTGNTPSGAHYAITFNGHMCKRVERNLIDGMSPLFAFDLTLLDFRGSPHDARIGGISYCNAECVKYFFLGVHDSDREEKHVRKYPNDQISSLEGKVLFIYDKDTRLEKVQSIKTSESSAEGLAEYLHSNIIGEDIAFGVATGVALVHSDRFELGVYNASVSEARIAQWRAALKT